jgi:hypothetical protein
MFVKGTLLEHFRSEQHRLEKGAEITVMSIGVSQGGNRPQLVGHCKFKTDREWIQLDVPMEIIQTIPPSENSGT